MGWECHPSAGTDNCHPDQDLIDSKIIKQILSKGYSLLGQGNLNAGVWREWWLANIWNVPNTWFYSHLNAKIVKILVKMRVVRGYCHQRGVSVSKPFPKLIISSHRKRYEWHENITLQAERFRRHVNHAEELEVEYSVVKIMLRRQPLRFLH